MSDTTARELAQNSVAPESGEREDRGHDWALVAAFFGVVLAMYAAIGFAVYSLVF
jgi:hypothetical protein